MFVANTNITFPEEEENEVTTVLKHSTYFLHDIYNWRNGNSNGTKIPTTTSDQSSETSEKEENGEIIEEEIFYIKKLIRNIVEIFIWTKRSISRVLKRSTRVALSAPKTLVLLLVPSILSQHNINAESLNGISTFPHGKENILSNS